MILSDLPNTAKGAKIVDSKYYFTGKLCSRGHLSKRSTTSRTCIECNGQWGKENIERKRIIGNRYYNLHYSEIKIRRSNYFKKYQDDNSENNSVRNGKYYKINSEKIKIRTGKYRKNNLEKYRVFTAKYRKNHPEKSSEYRKNNPEIGAANLANRRAAKLNRTPSWLTNDDKTIIKGLYAIASRVSRETGVKHHVDHIIPLRGDLVSGLHVPNNLQLLTATDNMSKGNNFLQDCL